MPTAGRVLILLLLCSTRAPARAAQAPTFQQISGYIEGGLEALGRGDTAGYRAGTGRAFAVAPGMPPVAYHHARALALSGETDSAAILLERLARQGAVAAFDAPSDSAFTALAASRAWPGNCWKDRTGKESDLQQLPGIRAARARLDRGRHRVGSEDAHPLPQQPPQAEDRRR
jgi:hypothetical protein